LHHSFPEFDRLFKEVDEMMKISRPSFLRPALWDVGMPSILHPSLWDAGMSHQGIGVTKDKSEYKVAMDVPDFKVGDLNVQLDRDGRGLKLSGERGYEKDGLKVHSQIEKAISFGQDMQIDTSQVRANLAGNTLTVTMPKKVDTEKKVQGSESVGADADAAEDEIHQSTGAMDMEGALDESKAISIDITQGKNRVSESESIGTKKGQADKEILWSTGD
jgi:HSP20 family molecular chaperone IbpA